MAQKRLEDWSELKQAFASFFEGIGTVETNNQMLRFHSDPSDVQTEFTITQSGEVNASMPLHTLRISFNRFDFIDLHHAVICHGAHGTYTYKIPDALLPKREASS